MPTSAIPAALRACHAAALALLLAVAAAAAAAAEPVPFGPGTTLRFATAEEGRAQLGRDDEWTAAAGPFQRRAIAGTASDPGSAGLAAFTAGLVRPWAESQAERWRRAAIAIEPRWRALGIPLPATVWLVETEGRNGMQLPHTRLDAVILSSSTLAASAMSGLSDEALLAHELFHVASRHDPALATRLYAVLGFRPVGELVWPEAWRDLHLANPDAPRHRHALRLGSGADAVDVMPVLVATRTELAPGESFFAVLELRLLLVAVDAGGGPTRAVLKDGAPAWLPGSTPAYLQALGGNTGYVIHPEETTADNVAWLVTGRTVPNPGLLQRLAEALRAPPR